MNAIARKRLVQRKQRIGRRLRKIQWPDQPRPMLAARNIQYEVAERTRGVVCGGIGAMLLVAIRTGRRIVYRLLAWNPWLGVLVRGAEALRRPMRC